MPGVRTCGQSADKVWTKCGQRVEEGCFERTFYRLVTCFEEHFIDWTSVPGVRTFGQCADKVRTRCGQSVAKGWRKGSNSCVCSRASPKHLSRREKLECGQSEIVENNSTRILVSTCHNITLGWPEN